MAMSARLISQAGAEDRRLPIITLGPAAEAAAARLILSSNKAGGHIIPISRWSRPEISKHTLWWLAGILGVFSLGPAIGFFETLRLSVGQAFSESSQQIF
jgi:hypothetical protein